MTDRLRPHKYDTSGYVVLPPRPCCAERKALVQAVVDLASELETQLAEYGPDGKIDAVLEKHADLIAQCRKAGA